MVVLYNSLKYLFEMSSFSKEICSKSITNIGKKISCYYWRKTPALSFSGSNGEVAEPEHRAQFAVGSSINSASSKQYENINLLLDLNDFFPKHLL